MLSQLSNRYILCHFTALLLRYRTSQVANSSSHLFQRVHLSIDKTCHEWKEHVNCGIVCFSIILPKPCVLYSLFNAGDVSHLNKCIHSLISLPFFSVNLRQTLHLQEEPFAPISMDFTFSAYVTNYLELGLMICRLLHLL